MDIYFFIYFPGYEKNDQVQAGIFIKPVTNIEPKDFSHFLSLVLVLELRSVYVHRITYC